MSIEILKLKHVSSAPTKEQFNALVDVINTLNERVFLTEQQLIVMARGDVDIEKLARQVWTTGTPTELGLYWTWDGKGRALAQWTEWSVEHNKWQLVHWISGQVNTFDGFTHWMGPIPQPEPPKESHQ